MRYYLLVGDSGDEGGCGVLGKIFLLLKSNAGKGFSGLQPWVIPCVHMILEDAVVIV